MSETYDESSGIAQRLEKLNQWQEEQKRILFEKQNRQRKLLGLEHRKMYETLGIYQNNANLLNEEEISVRNESSCSETDLGVGPLEKTVSDDEIQEPLQVNESKPKRTFLRRKQGLINRFKVDPDQFLLSNLPPYKFSSAHPSLKKVANYTKKSQDTTKFQKDVRPISKAVLKLKSCEQPKNIPALDALEEKFQGFLISSKSFCNSTPDTKSQSSSIKETPEPICWATILDPINIKPIEKTSNNSERSSELQDINDNMSIFELLEQKAKDGSFDLNSSFIKRFLKNTNKIQIEQQFDSPISQNLSPIPYEINSSSKTLVSDSSETEVEVEVQTEENTISSRQTSRVRFADDPVEPMKKPETNISTVLDNSDASHFFEEFKKQLFSNQSEISQSSAMTQELLQKAELVRTRLAELEAEINMFKENNLLLIKSKQEYELEKAHFQQECLEAAEKLNDERIQMEIYLHDERMKIEDDRKKMEKQIRHQKSLSSGRERREIAKLQEDIESLQKEMKKKEESHVAAQSRLRAQVRNLEKDVRQLNVETEVLTKENKRLEMENVKINRQNNNKMLQEINRNIAKLAPKTPPVSYMEEIPSAKASTVSKHSKIKSLPRRISTDLKTKANPIKRQDSPVRSSEDDLTSGSSDELIHVNATSKVTFAKSPTSPRRRISVENEKTNESQPLSTDASFKREIRNPDGSKDIWYPNGNLKKISPDGMMIRMLYFNKDIKETNINEGTVKYYYAETNTWHTTYLDGLEILEFPNGQTEHRYKDGKIEVHFPNNSIKVTNPSDENKLEEWRFADGTNLIQMKNGDKILLMPNGQKEIHTAHNKRREYPDGTVKLLYPDGSQETRYSNGRVRLKDKDGNLVMDTESMNY